jgi:hypothetical protein
MENSPKANKKVFIPKAFSAINGDNTTYYQYFYLSVVSLLLLVNVLFQSGITNIIIRRAWGMNNFSYFPWWTQVFIFILLFTLAVPFINNAVRLFIQKHIAGMGRKITGKSRKIIRFIGISLVITLLFFLFRVKYDLLGDMDLRVSQSMEGRYITDEYLTMYFMHYLIIFLQKLFLFTPHQIFVFASIVAGFFYSFIGLLIADLLFHDSYTIGIFFLFYICIGTVLVFCGYTEIYAIPAASASLYIYSALLYLKKKVHIILPFLCLVLTVVLHKEQISLLPSFVFLVTRKLKFLQKIDTKIIFILFLISIPLIYILNAYLHLQELMPLSKDKQFPQFNTFFSFSYWWELVNSQYISSGTLIFLFIIILFKAVKGQIQLDEYSKFFLIATLFIYSIVVTMNKVRGSGDWDVCSFPAIYLSMFVAYTALTQWKIIYSPRKLFYILSTALLLNAFSCWAWIGLNSGKKSLDKIEDMLLTDPGWYYQAKLPSEGELAVLFDKYGFRDKALDYFRLNYEKYSSISPAAATNYVKMLMKNKDTDKVIPVLENTVAEHPFFFNGYYLLFKIYQKREQYDLIYNKTKFFITMYDKNPTLVIGDDEGKNFLQNCLVYLYKTSLAKHDTLTTQDVLLKMQQLHIDFKTRSNYLL